MVIGDVIENKESRLTRECVMKDRVAGKILKMKIFIDRKSSKFWITHRNYVKRILCRFDPHRR